MTQSNATTECHTTNKYTTYIPADKGVPEVTWRGVAPVEWRGRGSEEADELGSDRTPLEVASVEALRILSSTEPIMADTDSDTAVCTALLTNDSRAAIVSLAETDDEVEADGEADVPEPEATTETTELVEEGGADEDIAVEQTRHAQLEEVQLREDYSASIKFSETLS